MEDTHPFIAKRNTAAEDECIAKAMVILKNRLTGIDNVLVQSREDVLKYLCTRVGRLEHEAFGAMFLGLQGELLACQEIFRGTIDTVPVFTREVAKAALAYNANAIVLYHNHPTSSSEPSQADIKCTRAVDAAMKTIGVVLLDHIIVAGDKTTSLDEKGLMPDQAVQQVSMQDLIRLVTSGRMVIDH